MSSHQWGDKDFDWKALDDAGHLLRKITKRYGRLGGDIKEKYGELRFYAKFGNLCLHTLIYPEYYFSQFPRWLWKLDCNYIGPVLNFFFGKAFIWWQMKVYRYAYKACIKKYPHIKDEILDAADYDKLLKNLK